MRHAARWTRARTVVALGFLASLVLAGRSGLGWLAGSASATRLFERVVFVDPLAAAEVTLARRALDPGLLGAAALVVGATLVLGPFFCGWLCPLGFLFELQQRLRERLRGRRAHASRAVPLPRGTRGLVLGAALGLSLTLGIPFFQSLSPILALVAFLVFGASQVAFPVPVLLALEWRWPRLFCRRLCPAGALHSWLGSRAPLRIRIDPARAGLTPCRQCTLHCPMGIRVMEDYTLTGRAAVDHPDCTRCGACIDACPSGVLALAFAPPRARGKPEAEPERRAG